MFERHPSAIALRGLMVAVCMTLLAGCPGKEDSTGTEGSGTLPSPPADFTANAGDATATLSWTSSNGATSYRVRRSTTNGGPYAQVAAPLTNSHVDTTVSNGTIYFYVVTAVNAAGESGISTQASVTPVAAPVAPPAPLGLVAAAGDAQITLSWSPSSGASSYRVKRSTTSGSGYTQVTETAATSYANTSLTNGTAYYYVVTAVNAFGESATSTQVVATPVTAAVAPAAPLNLAAAAGDAQATLNWSPSNGATSYRVKRSTTSGGGYSQVTETSATSYTNMSLANGTTYYYVVTAVNAVGESANSSQVTAIPVATVVVPAAPLNLVAASGDAQATLSWSASSGASSYRLKRSTTSGGGYSQVIQTSSTSYTNTSLTNGTTYYYVVSAVNSAGESGNSPQATAAPVAGVVVPVAPQNLSATAGNAQAGLSWSASTGATGYRVKRATTSGGPYSQVATATATSYTDTTVANGTTYYYVVSATNSAGESGNSAQASASPTAPPAGTFNYTPAPPLTGVMLVRNRDSVIIQVPAVANARDFRVLVSPTSVDANNDGTESVSGGIQYCAGVRQHQTRTRFVAGTTTLFPFYFYTNGGVTNPKTLTANFFNTPTVPYSWFDFDTPPHREIEVMGVTSSMNVTVEALDRLCPFPGPIGRQSTSITLSRASDVDHPDNPWLDLTGVTTFPIVTKSQVIARYGSLIINGHGWAGGPNVQANPPARPPFAQPAPSNPPKVLARAIITIAPIASPPAPPADFFDDFSNSSDQFTVLPLPNWKYPRIGNGQTITQNSKWTMYANGYTCCQANAALDGRGYADSYVDNGALHTDLSDWAQGILSEVSLFPRKPAHINATNYLHVTYEVNSFATSRRYWVVSLCGSNTAGATMDGNGVIKEQIVHTTFFYLPTGQNPSTAGWNCLQVFNREGNSYANSNWESMYNIKGGRPPVPTNNGIHDLRDYIYTSIPGIADPTTIAAHTVHPESDVMVLINRPIPAAGLPEVGGTNQQVVKSQYTSPVNVSPKQLDNPADEVAWFYKVDVNGNPVAPILDDQQLVSPRTRYDLYIRNNRLIMYVNGNPALCNDFTTPTTTLNIADAAVGFHQVFYHSLGESQERFVDPDRGAAYYYRYNTPWVDQRTWDNMGFEENVAAPTSFDSRICYAHASRGAENNEP